MKDCSGNYNIAERLAGKRNRRTHVSAPQEPVAAASPPPPRLVMTVEEMGLEMGISRATAYELAQRSDFPSFSIGRRVLVSRDGLLKWIEKQYSEKNPEQRQNLDA